MDKKEKIDVLVLCCMMIVFVTLSKLTYNFCMSKGVEYISKYIAASLTPLESILALVCWIIFSCLMFLLTLYLFCLWKDDFCE